MPSPAQFCLTSRSCKLAIAAVLSCGLLGLAGCESSSSSRSSNRDMSSSFPTQDVTESSGTATSSGSTGYSGSSNASDKTSNITIDHGSASPADNSEAQRMIDTMRTELDQQYVFGPTAANLIGYRVDWNRPVFTGSNLRVRQSTVEGDSIFVIDNNNTLTRILRNDGTRSWSLPVGSATDSILGVGRANDGIDDIVIVMTEGDIHTFNTANGVQRDRANLDRVASTAPVVYGRSVLYGSINGTVVWYHYMLNSFLRGYQMEGAVLVPPVLHKDIVAVVTNSGQLMVLNAGTGRQIWSDFARAPITAAPAISDRAVYSVSEDQFIRCYDINSGLILWKRLHSEPLREPPVLINDRVYVQTPDLGLTCYEALPFQDLDGEMVWNTTEVTGTIISQHRGRLMAWDQNSRILTTIDSETGSIIARTSLPKVATLLVSDFDGGDLYALSEDGNMTKVVAQ